MVRGKASEIGETILGPARIPSARLKRSILKTMFSTMHWGPTPTLAVLTVAGHALLAGSINSITYRLSVLAAVTERIQPEDRVGLGNGRAITTPELAATPKQAADRHGPVARVLAGLLETHSPTPAQDFSRVFLILTVNALWAA